MQPPSLASTCTFGRFRVDLAQRTLFADGEPAQLGARAFDVLAALIERRDRVVGKNELLDVVWPHLVVEENNLQVQIWALRKLLGPDVIATIPGRGYKFTAVLEGDQEPMPAQAAEGTAPSAPLAARTPTNLPAELAPLYGREADVQAVQRLVQEHRLVTIAGAGGIGKTRVGQAVAHALRDGLRAWGVVDRAGAAGRPGAGGSQRRAGAGAPVAQHGAHRSTSWSRCWSRSGCCW